MNVTAEDCSFRDDAHLQGNVDERQAESSPL